MERMTGLPACSRHGKSATCSDDEDADDLCITQRMRPDTISRVCALRLFQSIVAAMVTPDESSPPSLPSNYPRAYL